MPERTKNASQHVLVKPISCQQRHGIHLNTCRPNRSHAREELKCISTSVDQTPPMSARTQNVSQCVLRKPIPCQLELNRFWQNPSYANEATKCISTCVELTYPCQQWEKTYL